MERSIAKILSFISLIAMLSSIGIYQITLAAVQKQWPSQGFPSDIVISNNPADETEQYVTQASDGDYIITYFSSSNAYVQKISATNGSTLAGWNGGSPVIGAAGVPLAIAPDNSGGAYIAWNEDLGGGNCDVLLQRIDPTGTIQYGLGGTNITTGSGCEAFMQIIPDGSGGLYILWGNGGPNRNTFQSTDLYVTRMDSAGTVNANWNTGGAGTWRALQLPESQGGGTSDHSGHMVADGTGSIVVIYESAVPSFYFAATKFDANGNLAGAPWNTPLEIDTNANGNLGRHLISDGNGNVYVGFQTGPFGSPTSVEAQKINSAGALQWGTGVTVSSTDINSYSGQPRIVNDGSGGVIMAWQTSGANNDIYAHHVTSGGTLDTANNWASAPIALSDTTQDTSTFQSLNRQTALSDGAGGAYVLYGSYEGGSYAVTKLQHIESDGTVEFAGDGTTMGVSAGIEGVESQMASNGTSGVIVIYQDETGSGMDLYAQFFDDTVGGGSSGDNSNAEQEIICGALTLNVNNDNNFQMTNLTVSSSAQDSFGTLTGPGLATTYQDGSNTLPEEAFIYVNDTRTVGSGAGCATNGTDEGWIVGASSTTNFVDSGGIAPDISKSNFYFITTTNVTPNSSYVPGFTEFTGGGDGSDTNVFYKTGYSGTQDVTTTYNLPDAADLTSAGPFITEAASLNIPRIFLKNANGAGTNDFKFTAVGTGIAYYLNIPATQPGGNYSSTITISLMPAT